MRNLVTIKARVFIVFTVMLLAATINSSWAAKNTLGLPDFTGLVEAHSTAVVNISTSQKVTRSEQPERPRGVPPGAPFDDFLKRFFGDKEGGGRDGRPDFFDAKSLGSGFIISKDGYVLTNNHVIKEADEIIVRLSDRREFVAEVIGMDKRSDVALLKIDADDDLPIVKIGDSNALKVGEWVLAIGSPFGFDHTVTAGIVSAKGRSLPNENYVPFIQTDVAINPGNSGGPLFNLDGEVIGINSQIYSRTGGFMGLSFAIPMDMAMNVVDQLKDSGRVTRGWFGILIQDVTRELAESFEMEKPIGALVAKVIAESPAEAAGIKIGDVIVAFDGQEVVSSSALPPMVGSARVGETIETRIVREGKSIMIEVEIGELPLDDDLRLSTSKTNPNSEVEIERLVLVVSELEVVQKESLAEGKSGVYVDSVGRGPAAHAGLRKGDIIVMMDNQNIDDIKGFKAIVKGLQEGHSVPVLVQRRSGPVFLALKLMEDE
ncbi:MAG: DegQ family serine endoprotease [Gammaproteobacteria bacterium]|nr:DegQ family serine endoprotease [Gammaproteobacteria bacterium]